jgi:chromosome segregation ATPase
MVATLHQDLERARQRLEVLAHDGKTVRDELAELRTVIQEARERLDTAERRLGELELQRPELREQQDTLLATYNQAREGADEQRTAVGQIVIEFESRRAAQGAAKAALERVIQQRDQLVERIATLETNTRDSEPPLKVFQQELDGQLARQVEVQAELSRLRDGLTAVEQHVKASESQRHDLEKRVASEREGVEALRMQVRELEVRREALTERFMVTGLVLTEVVDQPPADADAEQWDERLAQIRKSIERHRSDQPGSH